MFGSELFSVGINVWTDGKWSNDFTNSWRASVTYSDYSHCNHEGIHGSFGTKYVNKLSFAVDTIIKIVLPLALNLEQHLVIISLFSYTKIKMSFLHRKTFLRY